MLFYVRNRHEFTRLSTSFHVMVQTRLRRRQGLAVGITSTAQLVAVGGERSGQVIMLADRLSIGRGTRCTLQLTEQVISRQHAYSVLLEGFGVFRI